MNEENLRSWKKGQSGNPGGVSEACLSYGEAVVCLENSTAIVKILTRGPKKSKVWVVRGFFDLTVGRNWNVLLRQDTERDSLLSIEELIANARRSREVEIRG